MLVVPGPVIRPATSSRHEAALVIVHLAVLGARPGEADFELEARGVGVDVIKL